MKISEFDARGNLYLKSRKADLDIVKWRYASEPRILEAILREDNLSQETY